MPRAESPTLTVAVASLVLGLEVGVLGVEAVVATGTTVTTDVVVAFRLAAVVASGATVATGAVPESAVGLPFDVL